MLILYWKHETPFMLILYWTTLYLDISTVFGTIGGKNTYLSTQSTSFQQIAFGADFYSVKNFKLAADVLYLTGTNNVGVKKTGISALGEFVNAGGAVGNVGSLKWLSNPSIHSELKNLCLTLSKKKTTICRVTKRFTFLGYSLSENEGLRLSRETLRPHRNKLKRLYEQKRSNDLLRVYVMHFWRWVKSGVDDIIDTNYLNNVMLLYINSYFKLAK